MFFARGVSPCQKWWWSLLGREISCSQWEGPSMHSRCLIFFLLMFWGGRGKERFFFIFPNFPMCSHYVPFKFPMGSQYFSQFFFPYLLTFICLGKWCPPFTYIGGPKGETVQFKIEPFVLGNLYYFILFGMMDGPIKLACCPKKTWEAPHLINRKGDYFPKFISLPLT